MYIVQIVTRFLLPYIFVYGFYVITHGHISPGGGFAGGAILGAGMILFALAFGLQAGVEKISHGMATIMESLGALIFVLLGLIGIILGGNYLANAKLGRMPLGEPGELLSTGLIPVITLAIGMKVASTMTTLFFTLIKEEEDADHRDTDH